MASTLFVDGTPIIPDWLNDVNDFVYGPGPDIGNRVEVNVLDYMNAAQVASINGTGPLVDCIDGIDAAIAACGDITWQGSMLAQRPSAGGMLAGGCVAFPPGVYMISRTVYVPPHVRLVGQSGGGFFVPRANDATTNNGNVINVKNTTFLANFPAGTGPNQAGQMWVIESANWLAGGASRPAFNKCFAGAADIDVGNISMVPGISIEDINIDSVRTPATGLHISNQIPYGAIKLCAAINARVNNVSYAGVDYGILLNAMWGFKVQNVFGYSFLGGILQINDTNAGKLSQVYLNRDETLDVSAPRSVSPSTRPDGIVTGSLDNDSAGFPEDFTDMRFGCYTQYANGSHVDSVTAEHWDISLVVNQTPNGGFTVSNFYSELAIISPMAAVAWIGSLNGFFDFSSGSRYGYCWGLVNSFTANGLLPRRLHCMPTSVDPNRNIQVGVAKPDLYKSFGGKTANMLSWSEDVTQGTTAANLTATAFSQTAIDGTFTAGKLVANGLGIASLTKSGANVASITGTTIDSVNYGFNQPYAHTADFLADSGLLKSAIELSFTGGTPIVVKAVLNWSSGVLSSITLSGDSSVTGFIENLGAGWYRVNVAGNCNTNTTMVPKIYIGDGTNVATAGQTLYVGHHELTPTAYPLAPIYNQSATVPMVRNPGVEGQGEHWEAREGINYLGSLQTKIRVKASGNPFALGYDTGNLNTGTFTTFDMAMKRVSMNPGQPFEIVINDGETVPFTANNNGLVQRNPNLIISKSGGGTDPTIDVKANPFGQVCYVLIEGKFDIQLIDVGVIMPSSGITDATLAGWLHFRTGRGAFGHCHLSGCTFNAQSNCALFQQGANTVNVVHLTESNGAVITGSGTARIHSAEGTAANSETKFTMTVAGGTGIGGVITASTGANGWPTNCTPISTAIS